MTWGLRLGVAALFSGAQLQAQSPPTPQAPVFRSRIDLMQLDVTVLDKDRRPVRDLTKDDFILLEDKTPQTIGAEIAYRPGRSVFTASSSGIGVCVFVCAIICWTLALGLNGATS